MQLHTHTHKEKNTKNELKVKQSLPFSCLLSKPQWIQRMVVGDTVILDFSLREFKTIICSLRGGYTLQCAEHLHKMHHF